MISYLLEGIIYYLNKINAVAHFQRVGHIRDDYVSLEQVRSSVIVHFLMFHFVLMILVKSVKLLQRQS